MSLPNPRLAMRAAMPVGGVALIAAPWLGISPIVIQQITLILILGLIAVGLNLTYGYAGELTLGQPAIYAAGAYVAGYASAHGTDDLFAQLVLSSLAAIGVGLIAGAPGLRLGGWTLAIASFFLTILIPDFVRVLPEELGGVSGLAGIPPVTAAGRDLNPDQYYAAIAAIAILVLLVLGNVARSRVGRGMLAMRHSESLAAAVGIGTYGWKLRAYAVGAVPAGIAGCLQAHYLTFISPEAFTLQLLMSVLAASMLGGPRSFIGAFVGTAIIQVGLTNSTAFSNYAIIAYGAYLIIGAVALRNGLAGAASALLARVRRRSAVPTATAQPTLAPLAPVSATPLRVDAVQVAFGGVVALDSVSLVAPPASVTAIVGPNGSGKTTLLNVLNGFQRVDAGEVTLGSVTCSSWSAHRRARTGVARTFQTPSVPEYLTVAEVVGLGRLATATSSLISAGLALPGARRLERGDRLVVDNLLDRFGLADQASERASELPLGTRRMLELARALAAEPSVVLLDEVASGLDGAELDRLVQMVRLMRDSGMTVVLVEHNFPLVRELADQVVVLAEGRVIATGTPSQVAQNDQVIAHYLGSRAAGAAQLAETGEPS